MKHTVQWYVWTEAVRDLGQVLQLVEATGISLEHPDTRRVHRLSYEQGHEGEQIETTREALTTAQPPLSVQFWIEGGADVVCQVTEVPSWSSILLDFDFDGLTTEEARRSVAALFEAQQVARDATVAWLSDRVGLCLEYGAPHHWQGEQCPAWPPDRRPGVARG